jgi:hypothetical protein
MSAYREKEVMANLREQPKMAYQICETLLRAGARVDAISSDHGYVV